MKSRTKNLILACLVPILILFGMAITPLYTIIYGEEIILETVPVDPSDLFRGDYVTLQYAAEEVPKKLIEQEVIKEWHTSPGNIRVYVLLEEKNGVHAPIKVTLDKPSSGIFLKGKLQYISENFEQKEVGIFEYSLDKYFVEDNTGLAWEEASAKGDILAKVKINNGYAYLVDILQRK